jgi:hypothetical protein
VVSLDDQGSFEDLTAAVKVKSADGSALVSGQRYLCTRTADASDGTAQFRTCLGGFIGARIQSPGQVIATATETALTFAQVDFDTAGLTAGGATTLTIPFNGFYHLGAMVTWIPAFTGARSLFIKRTTLTGGGDTVIPGAFSHDQAAGTLVQRHSCSGIVLATAGDVFEARATQTSGANQVTGNAGNYWTHFWAYKIG